MSDTIADLRNHKWGLASMLLGAVALVVTCIVIFAGPFTPQQSVGTTIGQIIGEISLSAMNTVRGEALPPPETAAWNIDRILMITGPILAVLAFLTAAVSAVKHDPWRLPTYGTVLGASAIVVQFLWWVALIVAGVALLISILENGPGFLEP
jgi:uncharacterized membrane protein